MPDIFVRLFSVAIVHWNVAPEEPTPTMQTQIHEHLVQMQLKFSLLGHDLLELPVDLPLCLRPLRITLLLLHIKHLVRTIALQQSMENLPQVRWHPRL